MIHTTCDAKIFRLGYGGLPVVGVDYNSGTYTDLETAAIAGDTVQVYGSAGNITVTKRLVFIGFGYNLDKNLGLQKVNTNAPSEISLSFYPGSDSSIAEGLSGNFYIGNQTDIPAGVGVSKVILRRCAGYFYLYNYYGPVADVKITSSVINGGGQQYTNRFVVSNLQLSNSIIYSYYMYDVGSSAAFINCVSPAAGYASSLTLGAANCLIRNCIFAYSYSSTNINTVYENNFFNDVQPTPLPVGTNNRWGQDWGVLFNRLGGTDDLAGGFNYPEFDEDYYILKAGSPAINGGFNAANQPTNCGIYGGEPAYVYKLSGVPAVPAIYKLEAPSLNASSNPYNVTISVRSNN